MINSEEGRAPQWRPFWPRGLCAIFIRCRGFLITHEKEFGSWRQFSSNLVTIVDVHLRAGRRSSPCEAMKSGKVCAVVKMNGAQVALWNYFTAQTNIDWPA